MNIWIINGPNLNMLGIRDRNHYGDMTLSDLNNLINIRFPQVDFTFYQSNHEGEIIDWVQYIKIHEKDIDGLIINAGGYSHTSIAIADCVELLNIVTVEVHLSDIKKREKFRHNTFLEDVVSARFMGEKATSYSKAVEFICQNSSK